VIDRDEHLHPGTTLESLAGLESALVRQGVDRQDAQALVERIGS
jgi:hypothetical protein